MALRERLASWSVGLVFLLAGALPIARADEAPAGKTMVRVTRSVTIAVGDVERTYVVHAPPEYTHARKWPLVVMFHGGGGTARAAIWETGWDRKADREGFLAVFPEGTPPDPSRPGRFRDNPQTWNDGSNRANIGAVSRDVADVEFVAAMLDDLKTRFNVDEQRIYVTGFSNGASMAFRVARELSPIVAAVAPVAGADWLSDTDLERPIPLLYLTGTRDPLNPIAGGEIRIGEKVFGTKPAVREMIGNWVRLHGYPKKPVLVARRKGGTWIVYGLPTKPADVILCTIDGHGHHWPGGNSALPEVIGGRNTAKLNATDVIWRFFSAHSLTADAAARQAAADAWKP